MPSNPQKNRLSLDFYCPKIVFHIYKGIKAIDITPIRILFLFLFLRRRSICKSTKEVKIDRFLKRASYLNKTAGHQSYIFDFADKHHNISVIDNESLKPVYSDLKERRIHIIIDIFSSRLIGCCRI